MQSWCGIVGTPSTSIMFLSISDWGYGGIHQDVYLFVCCVNSRPMLTADILGYF